MNLRCARPAPASITSILVVVAVLCGAAPAGAETVPLTPFAASPISNPSLASSSLAQLQRVDLDGVPSPDLAALSSSGLIGLPSPGFVPAPFQGLGIDSVHFSAAGDVNGDGRRDGFVFGVNDKGSDPSKVLLSSPSGLTVGGLQALGSLLDATLADVSGDGKLDVVATTATDTRVLNGNGAGAFATPNSAGATSVAIPGTKIDAGDLNGDGRADVVVGGTDGTGPFVRTLLAPALTAAGTARPPAAPLDVLAFDATGDTLADAVAILPSGVYVYPTSPVSGSPLQDVRISGQTGLTGKGVAVVDLDRDGNQDLVLATPSTTSVAVMVGRGDGTFEAAVDVALAGDGVARGEVGGIVSGDFDGDFDQDVAVASYGSGRVDVLRNALPAAPLVKTFPADPVGVETATFTGTVQARGYGGSAHFEWGETLDFGNTTPEQPIPPGKLGARSFTAALDGLQPERAYHVRLVATTTAGTTVGNDVLFLTGKAGDPDVTVSLAPTPDVAVSGDPVGFRAEGRGSFPPYTYEWNFGDETTGTGDTPAHAFPARTQNSGDADRIKSGTADGLRRGSYELSVTAKDRFGRRSPTVKRRITIIANGAPETSILPLTAPLEYAAPGLLASGSHDPDTAPDRNTPVDRVIREEWNFDGQSALTRDPGLPSVSPSCFGDAAQRCAPAGASQGAVSLNPWVDDLHGKQPIAGLTQGSLNAGPIGADESWESYNDRQNTAALALKLFPSTVCGVPEESQFGCWPNRTSTRVTLHAVDRGGKDVTVVKDVPIRLRARPSADVDLTFPVRDPGGDGTATSTGAGASANAAIPEAITAQDPSKRATTGTLLAFDPGKTTVDNPAKTTVDDGREVPVWYAVQIGKPWQRTCGKAPDVRPDPIAPQEHQKAIDIGKLPPIAELPGGVDAGNQLTQIGVVQNAAAGRASRSSAEPQATRAQGTVAAPIGSTVDAAPVIQPSGKCREGFGVNKVIASVVSTNPDALRLTIPTAGVYSALLTAYDRTAGTSRVRLDGLTVQAASGTCKNVAQSIGEGQKRFNFTSSCVSNAASGDGKQVYWTKNAMDINGVRVAPAPGHYLVADARTRIKTGDKQYRKRVPSVYSAVAPPAVNAPGAVISDVIDGYDPKADKEPASIVVGDQAILKRGLYNFAQITGATKLAGPAEKETTYGGLALGKSDVLVDFGRGCGAGLGSMTEFTVDLPAVFAQAGVVPTRDIQVPGCNAGKTTVITKKSDSANKARIASAARYGLRGKARGKARYLKGKRAELSSGTISLPVSGLTVGPVTLKEITLSYDAASKTFVGNGSGLIAGNIDATVRVAIVDGDLAEVSGKVSKLGIQLGTTPTKLDALSFKMQLQPKLVLVGGATITSSDGVILRADGTLTLETNPVKLALDGTARLVAGAVPLATVHIEVGDGKAILNANAGSSFGPFSYKVGVGGSFSKSAFNIEGSGSACIFACLGVQGILSSKGAALCGEIDLWVKTFRPGVGILWDPFDVNAYLDGCGLGPYRAALDRLEQVSLSSGQSKAIPVEDGQTLLSVVAKSGKSGAPPKVTLTGPAGSAGNGQMVVRTPADDDNSSFDHGTNSVVDVDRISGQTRFMIAAPKAGDWKLSVDEGSTPVVDLAAARDQALPTAKSFGAKVAPLKASDHLDASLYGSLLSTIAKPSPVKRAATEKITLPKTSKAKKKGLQRAALAPPGSVPSAAAVKTSLEQMGSRLSPSALGPELLGLRRKVSFAADLGGAGTVTFVERGDDTAQTLASYAVADNGRVKAKFAFLPGLAGDRKRHVDAYILSETGIPRGVVKDVDTFTAPAPPKPKISALGTVKASGKGVSVTLKKAPAFGVKSTAPLMFAIVKTKRGSVSVVKLTGRDFKKKGAGYTAVVKAPGAKSGGTVTLKAIDASGVMVKGSGSVRTVKLKP